MKAYPILYITLMIIGSVLVAGALIGLNDVGDTGRAAAEGAAFYGTWILVTTVGMILVSFTFWVFSLVHLLRNRAIEGTEKIVWLLVTILLNAFGGILYFFIAPDKDSQLIAEFRQRKMKC